MNKLQGKLTMERALEIQSSHLAEWETVLKPDMFLRLKAWAEQLNAEVDSPYDVRRGQALTEFVINHLMRKD